MRQNNQMDEQFTGPFPRYSGAINSVIGGSPEDMNEMPAVANHQSRSTIYDGSDLVYGRVGKKMKHIVPTIHRGKKHSPLSGIDSSGLGDTMGSSTGEEERAVEAGGWSGTDDATSTAPSDQMGNPSIPESEKSFHVITRDFEQSIQLDEERQQESAEESEARLALMDKSI
jgi:hypothetical protein